MARRALGVLPLICLAITAGTARADAAVQVPSCAMFLDFGERWIGLDEATAAEVLGVPLYALTDADIDLVAKGLQACLAKADTPEAKAVLQEDMKHMSSLTAARNRVRRAFADYEAAKKKSSPSWSRSRHGSTAWRRRHATTARSTILRRRSRRSSSSSSRSG